MVESRLSILLTNAKKKNKKSQESVTLVIGLT
jgi:hypothetical protein